MSWLLNSDKATEQFGGRLVDVLEGSGIVFLKGDLGAGKTTLCRGVLRALGYTGAVKSPTFTLVEPYELPVHLVYHFDLYRLSDPDELNYLGVDEYFTSQALCLIEWPENIENLLPLDAVEIHLTTLDNGKRNMQLK